MTTIIFLFVAFVGVTTFLFLAGAVAAEIVWFITVTIPDFFRFEMWRRGSKQSIEEINRKFVADYENANRDFIAGRM